MTKLQKKSLSTKELPTGRKKINGILLCKNNIRVVRKKIALSEFNLNSR